MELEKFRRQLKLMSLLAGNTSLSVDAISERLGISRRTVYRYIRLMKDSSLFSVEQSGEIFRLGRESQFFREVSDNVSFSEDEASLLSGMLASAGGNSIRLAALRRKLARIYNYRVLESPDVDRQAALNFSRLYEAIKQRRVVMLKNYHSLHGNSVSNRSVEPFAFLNSNDDVRCYEISADTNKTFKVSRAEEVIILDLTWSYADRHEIYRTDLFGFTDKRFTRVVLRLTARAARILCEERPAAASYIRATDDGFFILDTEVCSFRGISRFVLGLYSDVEVVDSPDFEEFIRHEAALLTEKFRL